MKILLCGAAQAGQQELFSILTGISLDQIRLKPMEVQVGTCDVKDPRITKLSEMYKPKKTTYAKIEYTLIPDFSVQGPAKALIANELKNADEICWISKEESAEADIPNFISELIIQDMMLVEKRLESLAKEQKKKYSEMKEKDQELMEACKAQLNKEQPLFKLQFTPDQVKSLKPYQFLSLKPVVLAVNVAEDKLSDKSIPQKFQTEFSYPAISLSAGIEEEISRLSKEEQVDFMKDLGIEEPALNKMTRIVFEGLGLISFFTVGEDEVRAWPIKKGSTSPEAGATIHSDIERGYVCAELMKYSDLIEFGSEAKLKELGKFSLKGRDYVVEDSDILSFRFNV